MIDEKDDIEVNENLDVFDTFHELLRRRKRTEKYTNMVAAFGNGGGSSSSNNSYVQAALNRGTALGYTLPNAARITALNTFFDSINSLMSLAESIKIYALNNALLSNFSTLNYVDPTLYQSTLINSPTYGVNGFRSNGTDSYVNENIPINRRAGIEDNFSELASSNSAHTTDESNMYLFGATGRTGTSCRTWMLGKAFGTTGARMFNNQSAAIVTTNHDGFYSMSSNGVTVLRPRHGKNGSYIDGTLDSLGPTGLTNYNMFTCAINTNGTPSGYHSQADVEFKWSGFELSDANIATISAAFQTYLTAIGL